MYGQGGLYRRSLTRVGLRGGGRGHGMDEQGAWGKVQGAGSREQLKGFGEWKLDMIDTYVGVGKPGISFINRMLEWLQ